MILVLAFSQELSYVTVLHGLSPETHMKVVLKMAHGWSNVMLLILIPKHSNNGNPILTTKLLVHFYSVLQSMSSFTTEKKNTTPLIQATQRLNLITTSIHSFF
jgi:hypothetical protein